MEAFFTNSLDATHDRGYSIFWFSILMRSRVLSYLYLSVFASDVLLSLPARPCIQPLLTLNFPIPEAMLTRCARSRTMYRLWTLPTTYESFNAPLPPTPTPDVLYLFFSLISLYPLVVSINSWAGGMFKMCSKFFWTTHLKLRLYNL